MTHSVQSTDTRSQFVHNIVQEEENSLFLLLQCHLEELDSDAGEHELQQSRDDHDVSDRPDGHKHTLDHVLKHTGYISNSYFL